MLNYSNIVNDPYPDIKDPVSGHYFPASHAEIKAMKEAEERKKIEQVNNSQMASMLSSILK